MQIDKSLVALAGRQFGVLAADQLEAAGLSPSQVTYRVRQGWFCRLAGGVVVLAGSTDCWERRVCAAALAAGPLGAASHRSAARLWGMRSVDDEVEVSVRYPRHLRLPGAVVHRSVDLVAGDLTWVEGIPTTTIERTVVDLGLIFPEEEVMRILRHAIATGAVSRHDVLRIRRRVGKPGRNGPGVAGRCLDRLPAFAEETESGNEVLFLEICERFFLPLPDRQVPVIANGSRYRLDFAYADRKLFVEIDGAADHSAPLQIAADGGRQNDLVGCGWRPIWFPYDRMRDNPESCAWELRQALDL